MTFQECNLAERFEQDFGTTLLCAPFPPGSGMGGLNKNIGNENITALSAASDYRDIGANMCGIAGIYRYRGKGDDSAIVQVMLTHLERRGPDDGGIVVADPAVLSHRRLAILDLSASGHEPMESPDGRYVITFNGEIYNYEEVHRELGVEREAMHSRTDTEILLLAWERWGAQALSRLVGQWAFAVFDRVERRLWLARDRFGEKPLFYHEATESLVFASSLEALVQHPQVPRELDPDCLVEYVTLRYVVSPRTVLCGVKKLGPGQLLEVGPEGSRVHTWWMPPLRRRPRLAAQTRGALVEEFDALFNQASDRCIVSDVPVALLLSDGIDSQSIRSVLTSQGRSIPAYTFRLLDADAGVAPAPPLPGSGPVTDIEVSRADRVAQMVPAFGSLTEPVGDGAMLATWMLIRAARARATVFLCGHGGDEVLGGYRLSQDRFRLALLRRLACLPLAWVGAPLDRFLYGNESVAERRRRLREAPASMAPAVARYLIHRPLPYEDIVQLFGGACDSYLGVVDCLYRSCATDACDLDRMQQVMLQTFLSHNILPFADSAAMDSSAELRMPFLDRDLVEFVLGLPAAFRVSRWPGRANTKRILRWWAEGRVAKEVITRRKRHFQFGSIADLLRYDETTLKSRILDVGAVRRVLPGVEAWLSRPPECYRGPWEGTLWALEALGIWCERVGVC
jgi:asparagine synthase (glutamine-hydrolysing)